MSAAAAIPPGIIPNGDTARTRYNDPETSHLAADSNTDRELVEEHVYSLFQKKGPMTDWELTLAYIADDTSPAADWDSPRKRRSDLTKANRLVPTLERRPGRSGRLSIVFTIPAEQVA